MMAAIAVWAGIVTAYAVWITLRLYEVSTALVGLTAQANALVRQLEQEGAHATTHPTH